MKYFIVAFFLSFGAFAQSVNPSNTQKIGNGTASDKNIIFNRGANNPRIRWSESNSRLQFTNDGTNFRNLGSGAGGGGAGINALQDSNFDFEAGTTNWTLAGGTFVVNGTPALNGTASGEFTASASGQTLRSALVPVSPAFFGRSCQVDGLYRFPGGTAGSIVIEVLDGSNNVLAQADAIPTVGIETRTIIFPQFTCPTSGSFRWGLRSTAASGAGFRADDIFLGSGRNTVSISQSSFYASASWAPSASCNWLTTSATYGDFSANVSCNAPTISGAGTAPGTRVPHLILNNITPGDYYFTAPVHGYIATAASVCWLSIVDESGVVAGEIYMQDLLQTQHQITGRFTVTTTTNKTLRLQARRQSGTGSCGFWNDTLTKQSPTQINVYRFPSSPADAINFETSGGYVEARIRSTNNTAVNVGLTTQTVFNSLPHPTLELQSTGTIAARIGCNNATSTGSTCSGVDELLAVNFSPHVAGNWMICYQFSHFVQNGSGLTGADVLFDVAELNPVTGAVINRFNNAKASFWTSNLGSLLSHHKPINLCSIYNFATAGGDRRIGIARTQEITNVALNQILTDQYAGVGGFDRNVYFYAYPLNQSTPPPVFPDIQNSLRNRVANSDSGQTVQYSAYITNAGSCAVNTIYGGSWIASVSRPSTGVCDIVYAAGFFNGTSLPVCTATAQNQEISFPTINAGSISVQQRNSAGAVADSSFTIQCMGRR